MSITTESVSVYTGTDFTAAFTAPAQRVTILDLSIPSSPKFPRNIILTNNGIYLSRPGLAAGVTVASLISAIVAAFPSLTVAPIITTQPAGMAVVAPAPASFSVVAFSELTATYQWQYSIAGTWTNLVNAGVYSGVTSATLSISNSSGLGPVTIYRCLITNSLGTVTSATANLVVN